MKIEILAPEEMAPKIVEAILESAQTGKIGDGKIFVSTVEEVIRIQDERARRRSNQLIFKSSPGTILPFLIIGNETVQMFARDGHPVMAVPSDP